MTTDLPYLRGSGSGSDEETAYVPVEDPNTAQSKATWRVIDLICEGEIGGLVDGAKSIYFNDVQLRADSGTYNFEGVTWAQRVGTPDQSYIPGYPAVENSIAVGAEVSHGTPLTRTISDENVDAVRVHLSFNALWHLYDNGDLKGSSVTFTIEVVGHSIATKTITDKFTSPYEVNYRVALPAGGAPWDIRVTKVTADAVDSKTANTMNWASYTEIIDHKLTYPDSALMAGSVDSSLFGGRIPTRKYLMNLLIIQVPDNYNPVTREYTGIWGGGFQRAWSNNPAWCFYDMLVNDRYGLGLTAPDKWTMYVIGQYCDELVDDGFGGLEPRFVLNALFNTAHEAYSLINTLASVFRGMPLWSAGSVSAFQDAPADPQLLVSPANVIGGVFSYEGTNLKSRYTVAYITWNDPDNQYEPTIEAVTNAAAVRKYGYRKIEAVDFGCSRGQARRMGLWLTDTSDAEKETVVYNTGLDHAYALPGWIVEVADPWVANARMGGRLKDGFESSLLGSSSVDSVDLWGLQSTVTRVSSGTIDPKGNVGYTFTESSAVGYSFAMSDATDVPYASGELFVLDGYIEKDAVSSRVVTFGCYGYGGIASGFACGLRTDTGEYIQRLGGSGASVGLITVNEENGWWHVRVAGKLAVSCTYIRAFFYPAAGTTLTDIYNLTATGSATLAGVYLRKSSTADYDLLDPRLTLRLDAPVAITEGETYLVTVTLPDGTVEQRSVINDPGETDVLQLATALSDFPTANSMFVVTGTDLAPRRFRILSKVESDTDGEYQITAIEHDPNKYARIEQGLTFPELPYSTPSSSGVILPPNNPIIRLRTYYADGQLKNMLVFSWEAAADDRVVEYQVEYRVDDGNWVPLVPTSKFLAEMYNVQSGLYYFRVRSVTRTGAFSIWAVDDLDVAEATMPDVTGLELVDGASAIVFTGGSAKFHWDSVALSEIATIGGTDPWFKSYIVEVWKSGALVRTEYPVIPEYEYTFAKNIADSGPDREFTVKVYQLGNLGQISNTPAVLTVSNPAPSMAGFTPVTTEIFKGIRISWVSWSTSDADLESFEIRLDTSNPPTTLIETVPAVTSGYTETGLDVGVDYYVMVTPRDAFGAGVSSSVGSGAPVILEGADVDLELAESITMSDSDANSAETLSKLYDRNKTSDGVAYTLSGTDKQIQYQFGLATYIDKVIVHMADANAQVYFAYSQDGDAWYWLCAEADHTLTDDGELVSVPLHATAQANYLQLAAGLNVAKFPQRVVARYCRLYLTGTYSTEIYELVFVREVIAEQVVADNLSAISTNIGSIVAGYMQSANYSATDGVMIDLDNGVFVIGGSGGGDVSPGLYYDGVTSVFSGKVTLASGSTGYTMLDDAPVSLADINSAEYADLSALLSGTVLYRSSGAPTNVPVPLGLTITNNTNATCNITVFWDRYTQGGLQADVLILFWRKDGEIPTVDDSALTLNVNTGAVSYFSFEGVNPEDVWSFGIAAGRRTENGVELTEIQTGDLITSNLVDLLNEWDLIDGCTREIAGITAPNGAPAYTLTDADSAQVSRSTNLATSSLQDSSYFFSVYVAKDSIDYRYVTFQIFAYYLSIYSSTVSMNLRTDTGEHNLITSGDAVSILLDQVVDVDENWWQIRLACEFNPAINTVVLACIPSAGSDIYDPAIYVTSVGSATFAHPEMYEVVGPAYGIDWLGVVGDPANFTGQIDGTLASTLVSTANAASAAANDAQIAADQALDELDDITSDSLLTPDEKPRVIMDFNVISGEQAGIDAQATLYGITAEKASYDDSITALTDYLATLTAPVAWNNLAGNTTIVGTVFRGKFEDVYEARQVLLNKIFDIAKSLAEAAATTATWGGLTDIPPISYAAYCYDPTNLCADPDFSRTTAEYDETFWSFSSGGAGWSATAGVNSGPCAVVPVVVGEYKSLSVQNNGGNLYVPVTYASKIFVTAVVKKDAVTDGTFRLAIWVYDKDYNYVGVQTIVGFITGSIDFATYSGSTAVEYTNAAYVILGFQTGDSATVAGEYYVDNVYFGKQELGATEGADWSTNLANIPTTLADAPSGSGLYLNSSYMGYYSGSAWRTYMDNSGNFFLGSKFAWNAVAGQLSIKSATTGARLEIYDNVIKVYDAAGVLRVQLGDLS